MPNQLPNAPGYQSSSANPSGNQQRDLDAIFENKDEAEAQPNENVSIQSGVRKVIRGKAPGATPRTSDAPTIRGGGARASVKQVNENTGNPSSN